VKHGDGLMALARIGYGINWVSWIIEFKIIGDMEGLLKMNEEMIG